jgi:hypothetical protein
MTTCTPLTLAHCTVDGTVRRAVLMLRAAPALLVVTGALGLACPVAAKAAAKRTGKSVGKDRAWASKGLFASDSVWNLPQKRNRPGLDPSSGERVRALSGLIEYRKRLPQFLGGGYPGLGADTYSTPIYRVARSTRRVPVTVHTDPHKRGFIGVAAAGVPIPPGATPAAGTDGHMTIYQPSTDTLWEFWRAVRQPDGWHASWGGAIRHVSRSPGYYSPNAWPDLPKGEGWNWGSTATSLPVAGGTVTTQELRKGHIPHALAMAVPLPCKDVFSWPAQRDDGVSTASDCLPEGARLRLDPAVDVDALNLHPVARTLARAAQEYGIIVRDQTRVSAQFYLESPQPAQPSPYTGPGGLFAGAGPWQVLEGFPWDRLQLLPLSLCRSAPCHRRDPAPRLSSRRQ